jgi:hypothetical protein
VVSIGSAGHERQIQNVAAGVVSASSTDAVNGSQLYAVGANVNSLGATTANALGGGSTYTPGIGVSAPSYAVQGRTYNNVGAALGAVDNNLSSLQGQVSGLSQDVGALQKSVQRGYEGTAIAIAHTSPTISRDANFGISGKWGNFSGQNALGVTAQARVDKSIVLNASVGAGLNYGTVGVGVGASYEW